MEKNNVFGNMNLVVSVPVKSEDEAMGLQEANFNINTDRIIGYRLTAIDHKGKEHQILVHDALEIELNEFVGQLD